MKVFIDSIFSLILQFLINSRLSNSMCKRLCMSNGIIMSLPDNTWKAYYLPASYNRYIDLSKQAGALVKKWHANDKPDIKLLLSIQHCVYKLNWIFETQEWEDMVEHACCTHVYNDDDKDNYIKSAWMFTVALCDYQFNLITSLFYNILCALKIQ